MGTCVDAGPNLGPCVQTFLHLVLVVFPFYQLVEIYTAHVMAVTGCNLRWWCFPSFYPFNRHEYYTYTQATCTVWWWSVVVVVVVVVVIVHVLQCVVKNKYASYITVVEQPWGKTSMLAL